MVARAMRKASLTDNKLSLIDLMLALALVSIVGSFFALSIFITIMVILTLMVLSLGFIIWEVIGACIERYRKG